jgi:uncharacterized protein (TIGR04255 family)
MVGLSAGTWVECYDRGVTPSARRLTNPPIIEALLELKATFSKPVEIADLERFRELTRDKYPGVKRQQEWTSQINLGAPAPGFNAPAVAETGFLLSSADGLQVIQARLDGMRFSRLKPYTSWQDFRAEAERLWVLYVDAVKPAAVHRAGVRYINRVDLPAPVDLKAYFRTGPEISADLPQFLGEFFFRVVIPTNPATTVILTEMTDPASASLGRLSVVLDIDASRLGTFEVLSKDLWDATDELQVIKNDFFFASFTEKGIALFSGEQ